MSVSANLERLHRLTKELLIADFNKFTEEFESLSKSLVELCKDPVIVEQQGDLLVESYNRIQDIQLFVREYQAEVRSQLILLNKSSKNIKKYTAI